MRRVNYKQYNVVLTAAEVYSAPFTPQGPNRVGLIIQNTGDNPALIRFEIGVQFDGGDFELAPGAMLPWTHPDNCPHSQISAYSELGTTLAVLEGIGNA